LEIDSDISAIKNQGLSVKPVFVCSSLNVFSSATPQSINRAAIWTEFYRKCLIIVYFFLINSEIGIKIAISTVKLVL
jgi:hypothetical protein